MKKKFAEADALQTPIFRVYTNNYKDAQDCFMCKANGFYNWDLDNVSAKEFLNQITSLKRNAFQSIQITQTFMELKDGRVFELCFVPEDNDHTEDIIRD